MQTLLFYIGFDWPVLIVLLAILALIGVLLFRLARWVFGRIFKQPA